MERAHFSRNSQPSALHPLLRPRRRNELRLVLSLCLLQGHLGGHLLSAFRRRFVQKVYAARSGLLVLLHGDGHRVVRMYGSATRRSARVSQRTTRGPHRRPCTTREYSTTSLLDVRPSAQEAYIQSRARGNKEEEGETWGQLLLGDRYRRDRRL